MFFRLWKHRYSDHSTSVLAYHEHTIGVVEPPLVMPQESLGLQVCGAGDLLEKVLEGLPDGQMRRVPLNEPINRVSRDDQGLTHGSLAYTGGLTDSREPRIRNAIRPVLAPE